MQRIRPAVARLSDEFGLEHALASKRDYLKRITYGNDGWRKGSVCRSTPPPKLRLIRGARLVSHSCCTVARGSRISSTGSKLGTASSDIPLRTSAPGSRSQPGPWTSSSAPREAP